MDYHTFTLECHRHQLYTRSWIAPKARGVVILVHGMGEHAGRYGSSVVPSLLDSGFHVMATDHFGHGKSEGKRGLCPGYDAVLDSIEVTMEKAREDFGDLPVFLYGHSMGGNAVLGYAMKRKPQIRGVISTSPLLRMAFDPPAWKMTMGKILKQVMPSVTLASGLDPSHMSRDPLEVKMYEEDPLNHDRVSGNFVFPFLEMGDWILGHPEELRSPVLLCHGTGDLVTSHKATEELGKKIHQGDLHLFEGGYHELQNDHDRETLYRIITHWLDKRLEAS